MSPALVVLTTVVSIEEAERLSSELVRRRHAACVNALPGVVSTYRWQGEVRSDAEVLLLIKTKASCFETLAAAIRELHSYEVPEILALQPCRVDERYLAWIRESIGEDSGEDSGEDA